MERSETEKGQTTPEDGSHLNRNRSFKAKQLVRSQAIRESHSPPRTVSPNPRVEGDNDHGKISPEKLPPREMLSPDSRCEEARQSVEIQITGGEDTRFPKQVNRCASRTDCADLLSHNPRVACVCVQCARCRGKRREHPCPIKQDSGIACSDDCPDCTGSELPASYNECLMKSASASSDLESEHICRCPDKPKNNLSRNDSDDRIDLHGVDLVNFIKSTLNKNPKDRSSLLKIEKELHSLVTDTGRCVVRFPVMTSYGRLLVHRCATLFQLSHHVDSTTRMQVMVSKIGTAGGRIPCTSFKNWCTVTFPNENYRQHDDCTQAKSILKRSAHSLDETAGSAPTTRSKSLEQRERDYEMTRRRIFSSDNCTQDESQWPWLSGPVKLLTPESGRNRLLKVQSLETATGGPPVRSRGAVSKSHSFGSYGGEDAPTPRLLSRQGDLASSSWRLSPSSSGYKTLSLRSTDSVTPSPTGGVSPEPPVSSSMASAEGSGSLVWCVTDLGAVPPGALIIHPQTGRPLTNPDGSLYHYDPANPPVMYDTAQTETCEEKVEQNNEKRRGRLEKQNSFMDSECECPPPEDYRKSCCDCQKQHESCQNKPTEQVIQEIQEKVAPISPSNTIYETTNQEPVHEISTNQITVVNNDLTNKVQTYNPYETQTTKNYDAVYESKSPQYEQPIKTHGYDQPANQIVAYDSTNRSPGYDSSANRSPPFENRTNRSTPFDAATNIRAQQFYPNNRTPTNYQDNDTKSLVYAVHTTVHQPEQDAQSPQQVVSMQPNQISHDPHSGHLPLTVFPTHVRGTYTDYSQCRMEPQYQPQLYQPVVPIEEQKPVQHQDNTFRIDPSYPYAGVEYTACGACVDPNAVLNHHHRGVNVYAPPIEQPQVYPLANVILPQYSVPQYQQLQWQPNIPISSLPLLPLPQKPQTPPSLYMPQEVVYPNYYQYPVYPYYPLCPVYPVSERRVDKRTPTPKEDKVEVKRFERSESSKSDTALSRQNSSELALKIQQIKEQMASLNTDDKDDRRDKRRNNGNGILGSYPAPTMQNRHGRPPINDESQLTNAARAIVNSIRNMQGKQNYHYENTRRPDYHQNTNQHQNQNRDYREQRTEYQRTDYQKNYQRSDSFQYRNRYQRYPPRPENDERENKSTDNRIGPRIENSTPRNRPPLNVVRQITPGNWCRRSPAPPFTPAYRTRHPPPETKPRR